MVPESDMNFYLDQKGPRKERRQAQAFVSFGNGNGDSDGIVEPIVQSEG